MTLMSKVKAEDLSGAALSWAIESINVSTPPQPGQLQLPFSLYIDEAPIEHLIAKYNVWVEPGWSYNWLANARADRDPCERLPGETRAIAVSRAIVAVQLGNVVSVPAELM